AGLVVREPPGKLPRRARFLAAALGNPCTPAALLAGLAPLAEAARPPPGRLSEQVLVELLKLPTCPRPARQLLVERLGQQYGRPFANEWEFVAWARRHRPDLDQTSPPPRTTRP